MTPHYGLYADDDLIFLHQQDGGVCLTPGLSGLESPFEAPLKRVRCPHNIAPAPGALPPFNPLIDVLSPIPNGGAFWTPQKNWPLVRDAAQMSAPVAQIIMPIWATDVADLVPQLTLTNIAPLILVGYEAKHFKKINQLMQLPRVRTLLFCGALRPPGAIEVNGTCDDTIDWRAAGAAVLQQHVYDLIEEARATA